MKVKYLLACTRFLSNKTKQSYTTVLQQVIIKCNQVFRHPKPKYITMDFEIAAMSATNDVFGDSVHYQRVFFSFMPIYMAKSSTIRHMFSIRK